MRFGPADMVCKVHCLSGSEVVCVCIVSAEPRCSVRCSFWNHLEFIHVLVHAFLYFLMSEETRFIICLESF